ncbi:DUF6783 domain-containing protein [Blautia sp. HCP3S3_D9]|uniref:DUF6783 domain-containing protein n=1 Tax=Blautia sp. HCP3S3_D9 TaxID=3438912 RepID=UPI003F887167
MRAKYTAKWGVQIAGMIFQTRSLLLRSKRGTTLFVMPLCKYLYYTFLFGNCQ